MNTAWVHVAALVGWVVSNWIALVAGGYLGYKFGDKAKALAVKVLGKVL